ncbi:Glycoside hydrolase [Mycena kentingensis (nom. inval.)]|nr:Glycoside hydrolase [Mycena kentingensis (nom. inval.)]
MSQPPPTHSGTGGVHYDALPLEGGDQSNRLYNAPPSPRDDSFHLPADGQGVPYTDDIAMSGIPTGAAQPRFLGRALYDDGGANMRNSFASSNHTLQSSDRGSTYQDSVYGLTPGGPRAAANYSDSGLYRDEPGFFVHGEQRGRNEKRAAYASPRSRKKAILIGLAVVAVIAVAIGVVLALTVFKKKSDDDAKDSGDAASGTESNDSGSGKSTGKVAIVSGKDGSDVVGDDGNTFKYSNSFGGSWYYDVNDPFNNAAQAQSWTPPLNQTFKYGVDRVRGVNLGGWLLTEPFICPGLYQTIQSRPTSAGITIIDEWTLIEAMKLDTANGGVNQLEDHYKTFITEQDFMEIAAAGLNFVRIPIGYWAIEVLDGENFLPKVSWTYFLKAVAWARKYGLRINLDLHALPGSQNGWNHSGRLGGYGVMFGPMGIANAQRSLDYIRIIAEFISQPEYSDVIPMFGVTNEPWGVGIGIDALKSYYYQAYLAVRGASGIGEGKGPMVSMHEGFLGLGQYDGFLPNADRASMDYHPYLCFQAQSTAPVSSYAQTPCNNWGGQINSTMANMGFVVAGEFSNAVTDCGLYVNGVNQGTRYEGDYISGGPWEKKGECTEWTNWEDWSDDLKQDYKTLALASMDALHNYFFWTWKIGNATSGRVEAPHWSYQLGLAHGWMPTDPRQSDGQCGNTDPFQGPLKAWQTGGAGAGQIATDYIAANLQWPPASISFANGQKSDAAALPTYAQSGTPVTLPGPTFTPVTVSGEVVSQTAKVDVGNGWANPSDAAGMYKPVAGCSYLDPWVPSSVAPPSPLCTGAAARAAPALEARVTPAPKVRRLR